MADGDVGSEDYLHRPSRRCFKFSFVFVFEKTIFFSKKKEFALVFFLLKKMEFAFVIRENQRSRDFTYELYICLPVGTVGFV